MTLNQRIIALSQLIGDDIQTLTSLIGTLTSLTTTEKSNLVGAINEVSAAVIGAGSGDLISTNNLSDVADAATARANLGVLTQAEVDARVQLVVDTAPAALDTLNELAAALGDDANFATTIATSLTKKVDVVATQTFTVAEKLKACENIGIGNPDYDFTADYITARDS